MRKKTRGRKNKAMKEAPKNIKEPWQMTEEEFVSILAEMEEEFVEVLSAAEKRYRKECHRDLFEDLEEDLEAEIEGWKALIEGVPHGKLFKGRKTIGRGL